MNRSMNEVIYLASFLLAMTTALGLIWLSLLRLLSRQATRFPRLGPQRRRPELSAFALDSHHRATEVAPRLQAGSLVVASDES